MKQLRVAKRVTLEPDGFRVTVTVDCLDSHEDAESLADHLVHAVGPPPAAPEPAPAVEADQAIDPNA